MTRPTVGLALRASLFVGALVFVAAAAVGLWTYTTVNGYLLEREEKDLVRDAERLGIRLLGTIEELRRDVLYLAGTAPASGVARAAAANGIDPQDGSTFEAWRTRLEILFAQMLRTHPDYVQVRYIGLADRGREIVRVDRVAGRVRPIPSEALQRKGESRYFRNTLTLERGQIYLSDFELNREHGRIAEPHLAVLRAATPVEGPDGETFGIVIINMRVEAILDDLAAGDPRARRVYLVNQHGDFLIHPDPSKVFRFELGEPYRLSDQFPALAEALLATRSGAVDLEQETGRALTVGGHKLYFDPVRPNRFAAVLLAAPRREIVAASIAARDQSVAVGLALILASIGCGFYYTRRVMRQIGGEPDEIEAITRRVAGGDLDIELGERTDAETGIWASVTKMVASLRRARDEFARNDWLKTTLADATSEAQRSRDLVSLAQSMVQRLSKATGAGHGAFYLRSADAQDDEALVLLGSFALDEGRSVSKRLRIGEGLVGQAALEKRPILLTEVPSHYVRISSGTGRGVPICVLVMPVVFEDEVVAVLELASFQRFTGLQRELLDQSALNLGVVIAGLRGRERTEKLLEETQILSEKAQTQAEELRTSNEELEEKSRVLAQQAEEMESQAEELRVTNEQLSDKSAALERQADDLRQANEDVEQARREVERASAYKSEFLANMSHELRTPLNSLMIFSHTLASNAEGNLTPEQVEAATLIERGGEDLLRLINDILDLSKVEAGRLDLYVEPVPLRALADDLRTQFRPIALDKGVVLEVVTTDDVPDSIRTDNQRLRQILKNLLSNALKFTAEGRVTLRISRPAAGDKPPGLDASDALAIAVSDTGIGIPEDKREAVFESFTQADGSTSRRYGGTGLGLAISRQLADLLGGEIHLESEHGEGSTFTLYLPVDAETVPPEAGGSGEPREESLEVSAEPPSVRPLIPDDRADLQPHQRSLLIVEDDASFAAALMGLAREHGFGCLVASRGREGLQLASKYVPSAILLDLGLPDVDGLQVLEQLKQQLDTRHIPVHIVSGEPRDPALFEKGALGFMGKPVSSEQLERVFADLEEFLGRHVKTVLVVEDDADTRTGVRQLLESDRVRVREATSSDEARQALRSGDFDTVILGLELSDGGGRELLRELAADPDAVLPPVIVYTGRELSEEESRALHEHARAVIVTSAQWPERLLDEVSLFLHSIESALPEHQKRMIRMLHEPDGVFDGKRILVVDDDMRNTFALAKVLRSHGMEVVLADNGEMALEQLEADESIDLVLMDMMMPVMDGYEATRRIRSMERDESLPVIALTAKAMATDRERCLEAGADDYLTKPIDLERLLSVMRVWLFDRS